MPWTSYWRCCPTVKSLQTNLRTLCRLHLADRHEIEIVDVFKEPKRVLTNAVFITPTLVKLAPLPVRTIIGTLSQTQPVMQALGLDAVAS